MGQLFSSGMQLKNTFSALTDHFSFVSSGGDVVWGMLALSGKELVTDGIYFRTGFLDTDSLTSFLLAYQQHVSSFLSVLSVLSEHIDPYQLYLMISNPSAEELAFCLSSPEPLSSQVYVIKSQ